MPVEHVPVLWWAHVRANAINICTVPVQVGGHGPLFAATNIHRSDCVHMAIGFLQWWENTKHTSPTFCLFPPLISHYVGVYAYFCKYARTRTHTHTHTHRRTNTHFPPFWVKHIAWTFSLQSFFRTVLALANVVTLFISNLIPYQTRVPVFSWP